MVYVTSLRIPDELQAEASAYAKALGLSLNNLCAVALREYLDARRGQTAAAPAAVPTPVAAPVLNAQPSRPPSPPKSANRVEVPRVGPNQPCPCGSEKKYKKCHGAIGAGG